MNQNVARLASLIGVLFPVVYAPMVPESNLIAKAYQNLLLAGQWCFLLLSCIQQDKVSAAARSSPSNTDHPSKAPSEGSGLKRMWKRSASGPARKSIQLRCQVKYFWQGFSSEDKWSSLVCLGLFLNYRSIHPAIYCIFIYQYLSMSISIYLSMSIYIYPSLFISIHLYLSLSISIDLYPSRSISIHLYPSLSISIYLYLSLSICIYLYLSLSISIHLYLSLSMSIYVYLYLSISIYLFVGNSVAVECRPQ